MKTRNLHLLCMLIAVIMLSGCETVNLPATETEAKDYLNGQWEVVGAERKYNPGDGYRTEKISSEQIRTYTTWLFDTDKMMVELDPEAIMQDDYRLRKFTLEKLTNGYKLVIENLFEEEPNMSMVEYFERLENQESIYNSYITITRLTKQKMEWEYVCGFGGDEGPDYFHLVLEK